MAMIKRLDKGSVVARGILEKEEINRFFRFCKNFDIVDGRKNDPYLFDVRSGVVHWLDREDKLICSSMYFDLQKGTISIEIGESDKWNNDIAMQKWTELINNATKSLISTL